jgi:hypothetical protein
MDEWEKTNNILKKKVHRGHRELEEARRDRRIALRRVKSLESECKDLKELMIAMEQREVIYTLPHREFVSFYSTSLFNKTIVFILSQ